MCDFQKEFKDIYEKNIERIKAEEEYAGKDRYMFFCVEVHVKVPNCIIEKLFKKVVDVEAYISIFHDSVPLHEDRGYTKTTNLNKYAHAIWIGGTERRDIYLLHTKKNKIVETEMKPYFPVKFNANEKHSLIQSRDYLSPTHILLIWEKTKCFI